jgi:hypothetical protein
LPIKGWKNGYSTPSPVVGGVVEEPGRRSAV